MKIEKSPNNMCHKRHFRLYDSGRSAFKNYLRSLDFKEGEKVLLPAYIGWSSNEGSGVFDPIKELNIPYEFYRLNSNLDVDLSDFKKVIKKSKIKVLLIIHYFGYVDNSYEEMVLIARKNGVCILEDEAHAMYTDLIGGVSGRLGDACLFSLHKMLPLNKGGMLVMNDSDISVNRGVDNEIAYPWEYDLKTISSVRLDNAECIIELLKQHEDDVVILRFPKNGEVPQSLPVLIKYVSRDKLYTMMNELGFGVVSLYHTMIPQITSDIYPDSHFVSKRILNLPVHQDVKKEVLVEMIKNLFSCIKFLKKMA